MRRRDLLRALAFAPLAAWAARARAAVEYPPVVPGRALRFPQDEGSHPAYRTEWWYVTGWLADGARDLGFQVTFFRSRPQAAADNPSAFALKQLLFAHAGLSDPAVGRLLHDERAARAGFELAEAREGRTAVWIGDWSLAQDGDRYRAQIPARDFRLDLTFVRTQPPLLNGRDGFSQKGPDPLAASYYYSLPQLAVEGRVARAGREAAVTGRAWFDHEWSSEIMDDNAVGWDWIGINLADGGALMAFRMRGGDGARYWAGGTLRGADGATRAFAPEEIAFVPGRRWTSPRTGIAYPVEWKVRIGDLAIDLRPLMDDQENDARGSVGTVYWEGAVRALAAGGRELGRGYLELTGYGARLRL
ncbi:MAG: lipocalin-like domain-containing protein [Pseudomonadota bacterium]